MCDDPKNGCVGDAHDVWLLFLRGFSEAEPTMLSCALSLDLFICFYFLFVFFWTLCSVTSHAKLKEMHKSHNDMICSHKVTLCYSISAELEFLSSLPIYCKRHVVFSEVGYRKDKFSLKNGITS